ncbi:MAG: hypothetical protein ACFFB2_09330 [Promethearchaeota archaeon]
MYVLKTFSKLFLSPRGFFKTSTRLKDRVKAQELFQQVVDSDKSGHWLTITAHLNLVELLLSEAK